MKETKKKLLQETVTILKKTGQRKPGNYQK